MHIFDTKSKEFDNKYQRQSTDLLHVHTPQGDVSQSGGEMRETRKVTTKNVLYAISRDLDRDIRDPKTEHYSLSLLQKALIMTKRFLREEFGANDDSISAPIELQTGYLLAIMRSTIAIEATNFGYTLQNVEQAYAWLAAWKVAYRFDIDR